MKRIEIPFYGEDGQLHTEAAAHHYMELTEETLFLRRKIYLEAIKHEDDLYVDSIVVVYRGMLSAIEYAHKKGNKYWTLVISVAGMTEDIKFNFGIRREGVQLLRRLQTWRMSGLTGLDF